MLVLYIRIFFSINRLDNYFSGIIAERFFLDSKSLQSSLGLNVTLLETIELVNNTLGSVTICSKSRSKQRQDDFFLHPCSEYRRLERLDLRDNSIRILDDFSELQSLREIYLSGELRRTIVMLDFHK